MSGDENEEERGGVLVWRTSIAGYVRGRREMEGQERTSQDVRGRQSSVYEIGAFNIVFIR